MIKSIPLASARGGEEKINQSLGSGSSDRRGTSSCFFCHPYYGPFYIPDFPDITDLDSPILGSSVLGDPFLGVSVLGLPDLCPGEIGGGVVAPSAGGSTVEIGFDPRAFRYEFDPAADYGVPAEIMAGLAGFCRGLLSSFLSASVFGSVLLSFLYLTLYLTVSLVGGSIELSRLSESLINSTDGDI